MAASYPGPSLEDAVLILSDSDWLVPADFIYEAYRTGLADERDIRDIALGLALRLIVSGLIVPGDIGEGGKFEPWDVPLEVALGRLAGGWAEANDPRMFSGEVAWFDTTPAGALRATAALAEWGGREDREADYPDHRG